MSKESAVALLIIETAKKSFESFGQERLDVRVWDEVCHDLVVQKDVIRNYANNKSIFRVTKNRPTSSDFEDLRKEYRNLLDNFLRVPALRSLFLCYRAEVELFDELCGFISESIEEIVWEKLIEELHFHM